jgi:1-hydroxycarotenoid 3,4-desaturase
VVIGAGIGGLAAALSLTTRGCDVTVIEKEAAPGGKMRQTRVNGAMIDAGPTVLTMRWIFDELFAEAGTSLDAHVSLRSAEILGRHAWNDGEHLDLFADLDRSVAAIAKFAGPREAEGYRAFCARAQRMFETLDEPFIRTQRPRLDQLIASYGLFGLGKLKQISPFNILWAALAEHFRDPRLRQLFGRYATYCGSSPFLAPATLMLVAHVERVGVWYVEGGMHALATSVAALAATKGALFRYQTKVERIETSGGAISGVLLETGEQLAADAVVLNADVAALTSGLFSHGFAQSAPAIPRSARSLSAVTFAMHARTNGFPLVRHNVFFSSDYAAEFDAILDADRTPDNPTVYICAQDRGDDDRQRGTPERLLCLVNAPPSGDIRPFTSEEIARCESRMRAVVARCGLTIDAIETETTHPGNFETLFPGTGGALYGPASHGWQASFNRAGSRSKVPGLYLAGGSVHPGPGVPMATMSGRLAAAALMADRNSISRSRRTVMPGGISTR